MIEVALALSLAARHWTDAVIIGVLLAMNGLVAYFEEHQASNAIAPVSTSIPAPSCPAWSTPVAAPCSPIRH